MISRRLTLSEPGWLLALFPAAFYIELLFISLSAPGPQMRELLLVSSMPGWFERIYFSLLAHDPALWLWRLFLVASIGGKFAPWFRVPAFLLTAAYIFSIYAFSPATSQMMLLYVPSALFLCFLAPANAGKRETWVLEMIRIQLLLIFFAAGAAKLSAGSFWLSDGYLQNVFEVQRNLRGLLSGGSRWRSGVLAYYEFPRVFYNASAVVILLLELVCITGVFFRRARGLCVAAILLFWISQLLFFGWYFYHLTIFLLLFFGQPIGFRPRVR